MAVFYREGEIKKRPGIYQRHENTEFDNAVSARDGICAVPVRASWGPLGVVVANGNRAALKKNYGDGPYAPGFTVPCAKEMFAGGATTVYTYRLGTGGKAATLELTGGIVATAKYPGTASITLAVQTKLADPSKKECLVYFGTSLVESIDFKAEGTGEGAALIAAVNDASSYVTLAVKEGGTAPETVAALDVAAGKLAGGEDPTVTNDDYSKALDAFEPFYYNTIALDVDDDDAMALSHMLHAYIQNAYELGKLAIGVVGEKSNVDFDDRLKHSADFNDNKIVYVGNGYKAGDTVKEGALAICRTAGVIAATPSSQGITHAVIDEATDLCEALTYAQYEAAIDSGMLLFSMSPNGDIWYDSGINTLVAPDAATQDPGWKKIRRTKVRFEIIDRLDRVLGPKVGRISNDSDGIADVIQTGQRVLDAMAGTEGKLYAGATFEQNTEVTEEGGDSAYFVITADDIDSLEKIYMLYHFRYSQTA
ncbi:MAG: phage tail sheath subtilisin-like domain-containing protein [Peptococcaceae bacterium]|nr:phage tail sheath subtilisin-like domain-containing protein [Peptococcaceae bacterium]